MTFSTIPFIAVFAVLMVVLALTRNERARQWEILIFSVAFYAVWDWRYLLLVAACVAITHVGARMMAGRIRSNNERGGY